jgi:hypothetical protein
MLLRLIERLEQSVEPLLPRSRFYRRAVWSAVAGTLMYLVTLLVGVIGFLIWEKCPCLDAAVNSTMMMAQLGHVTEIKHDATKVFLLFYGPFASLGFFTSYGILVLPWLHRMAHFFHFEPPAGRSRR